MEQTLVDLLLFGLLAVTIGMLTLFGMVHFELGPAARLAGGKRWLLAIALGSGVLAFAIKLVLIAILVNFPQYTIRPLLNPAEIDRSTRLSTPGKEPTDRWLIMPDQDVPVSATAAAYVWEALPDRAPSPADNPTSTEKIALGKRLFFDKQLSRDGTVSCASCHDVISGAGADGRALSIGVDGREGQRNAPTVWNAGFQSVLFWDGRAASLEEQVSGPLLNPLEMAMPSLAEVERRVGQQASYRRAFTRAFGGDGVLNFRRIAQAIAAYERSLISNDSPYDRFVNGDTDALTADQLRGMRYFETLGCVNCHYGANFSAASMLSRGMPLRIFPTYPSDYDEKYPLREVVDASTPTLATGVWRVPSLRNVALTGPWLHNGSVSELSEAVRIMAATQLGYGGRRLLWSMRDRQFREISRPELNEQVINDLVVFLQGLSSDRLREAQQAAGRQLSSVNKVQ